MLWPVMLADRKGAAVGNRFQLWLGTQVSTLMTLPLSPPRPALTLLCMQFLTNVFFIPYMALREYMEGWKPNNAKPGLEPSALPPYASLIGWVGAAVGLATLFYVPLARAEYGGLADRWDLS